MAISADTQRKLLARSGGHCANPTCRADLFPDVGTDHIATVRELAHIIAQSSGGPRGTDDLPASERDTYANIVLLCPTCHTLIDKMKLADIYDAELIREWKRDQERRIKDAVEVPRLDSREALIDRVRALLRENRIWWATYGPESPAAAHPLSEASGTWLSGVRRVMIPNNWQILRLLERNSDYLREEELEVAAAFRLHADAFANRHLAGETDPYAPLFPEEMNAIFGVQDNDG